MTFISGKWFEKWVTNPFMIEALSDGSPFICLGSPISTASTFLWQNNLSKKQSRLEKNGCQS
jgi:hypothetical protein